MSAEGDKGRCEHRNVEACNEVAEKQRGAPANTHTEEEKKMSAHTHARARFDSTLAEALAAAAPALVSVRAKSRGRRVLPNAAVICFGNATAVSSHGPF